jgi:saccharopine dehydrogenase-like NADP-dependent oxidoreductase
MERPMIYDRQQELISAPKTVHIIGCGGVGTWAALMLAMAGVKNLHLYDDDAIDESNLNRLPYPDAYIGKSKTKVLADMLLFLRPDLELNLHGKFEPLLHRFRRGEPVIGAVDTMLDRQGIYSACREHGAYYIDVGAEAHSCTVSDSPADWSLVDDRPGYFTPIWVAPVCMAAALAVSAAVYKNISAGETVLVNLRTHTKEVHREQEEPSETVVGEQLPRAATTHHE